MSMSVNYERFKMSGSGSDSSDNGSPGHTQAMTGSPVGTTAMGTDLSNMSKKDAESQMAADASLAAQGYSKDYKGTNITNNGKAVSSGQYTKAEAQAKADYGYQEAQDLAKQDYYYAKNTGNPVDMSLSYLARGNNGGRSYIAANPVEFTNAKGEVGYGVPNKGFGHSYDSFKNNPDFSRATLNPNFIGAPPPSASKATNMLASNLATGNAYPRGGTDLDPFGNYLAATQKETMRDIANMPGGNKNQSYMEDFTKGYNSTKADSAFDGWFGYDGSGDRAQFGGKGDMNVDKAGNVGFQTGGQKFGDFLGESLVGYALPYGIGSGFDFNTQTKYGANVPGYQNTQSTTSYGIPSFLGGFVGSQVAGAAANKVGQTIYDKTLDVNKAIGGALLTGSATQPMVASAAAKAANVAGIPMDTVLSSDAMITGKDGAVNADFGDRLKGNNLSKNPTLNTNVDGYNTNGDSGSDADVQIQKPLNIIDTSGAYNTDSDTSVQSQFQDFNNQQFFADGSPMALNANTVAMSNVDNPLFSANPSVSYRQSGGKNRNYGNAISNLVNTSNANQSFNRDSRRRSFGDRLMSTYI